MYVNYMIYRGMASMRAKIWTSEESDLFGCRFPSESVWIVPGTIDPRDD